MTPGVKQTHDLMCHLQIAQHLLLNSPNNANDTCKNLQITTLEISSSVEIQFDLLCLSLAFCSIMIKSELN